MSKFGPIDGKTWTLDNAKHVSLTGWEQAILSISHSKQRIISSIEQDFLHQFWRFSLKKMRYIWIYTIVVLLCTLGTMAKKDGTEISSKRCEPPTNQLINHLFIPSEYSVTMPKGPGFK